MSLRYEQYWALKRTRDFMRTILAGEQPKTKTEMREEAYRCIKHFPPLNEHGKPWWSHDEFTADDGGMTK
jgi:hypothetical protein